MATVMTNTEFVRKLKEAATNYKTLYVMGCFGAPMNATNKKRYTSNHSYNKSATRTVMINAASADTYGFDCVCLIKGILWGWNGDKNRVYGGASYASNGVPDIGADSMIKVCSGVSTDFSNLVPGEAVWMEGHIGVYIGDGLAVECTPKWANKVQITACNCSKSGYNRRDWTKHGKLPYINYVEEKPLTPPAEEKPVTPATELKVGDIVTFKGNTHYRSSYEGAAGFTCKSGKAKVTAINKFSAHPYHLVTVSGSGSTVYGWVNASDIKGLTAEKPWTPAVGDIVMYKGNTHYVSANSSSPKSCKGGKAKITQIYQLGKSKHPYHLVGVLGNGSTVYGWVDAGTFSKV